MENNEDIIKIDFWDHTIQEELKEKVASEGSEYRIIHRPVKIEITTKETTIPAKAIDQFYSDGTAPNRTVPAGTYLVNSKYPITEEQFLTSYEEEHDEDGNVIPGLYRKIEIIRALKNPYGKPIAKANPNGYVIGRFDTESYLIEDSYLGIDIISAEAFNKNHVPYIISNKAVK